jgi:outer membrane receptor protein involved in Fe transport
MSKIFRLTLIACLMLSMSALAFAQSTVTGAIGGVITNPNKEVVPGAAIAVRNTETNKEDAATSDDEGRFRVTNLNPGIYAVTINATGFGAFTQDAVVVEVGRVTSLDVPLSIAGQTATVQVQSEAPVINTTQQDFSTNINQTSINELPINGRRWSNFALLTPGAVPDGTFGLISFRGISGLLNNNTVDGGDNNQAFFAEERGRTRISYSISQAAIREFQVNTSSYSAEYGRSAGGVVNAVTKSGTNEFHGSGFYYQRNNKWGARNPLAFNSVPINGIFTQVGIKPTDVRHQFGGAIGGPIVKNKAFFFFSYDQQKRNFPGLARFISGNFLNTADRCLLTAGLNTLVSTATCPGLASGTRGTPALNNPLTVGKGLTGAQVDNALNFLNSLSGEVPRRGDQTLYFPKVDWNITSNNTFTATYNRLRWASPAGIQSQATNTRAKDNFGDDFVQTDSLNLRLASTLSNTLVNEFRFQYSRDNEFEFSQAPLPGEPTNSVNGRSPQVFIANGFTFGIPEFLERTSYPDERRKQFADTVTYTAGNHTIKWGGDVNFVKDIINSLRFSGGEFNYTGNTTLGFNGGLNDFIIDYTNFLNNNTLAATTPCYSSTRTRGKCYGGAFNQGLGVLGLTMNTTDYNLFVQDDWRASSRLTLNLGLRYEYQKNPRAISANVNSALPQTANSVNDRNNFGPRVGFALDVNGDGKTSIRGGYGIYYGRVINSTVYNALVNTGAGADVAQRQTSLFATSATAPIFPNLISAGALTAPAVQYFSPTFQLPQIHQVDFVVERQITSNTVVSASYLFSYGNSLPNFVDINLNPPTRFAGFTAVGGPFDGQTWQIPLFTGNRPAPNFGQITEIRSNVYSKYNALVLQANRRLTHGLQFQINYTLSRAQDNGQTSVTGTTNNAPFNAFDQSTENGPSAFDRPHKFVASVVYNTNFASLRDNRVGRALFNGWTIAPIFNAFSGQRYSPTVSGTVNPINNFGLPTGTVTQGGGLNGSNGSARFTLVPRNFYQQRSIQYLDMRLSRRFSITEKTNIEILGEVFNLFNRTQITGVNASIYSVDTTGTAANPRPFLNYNTAFGTTTAADSTLFRERQVQFAVRFEF